jgi:hypothetical protein
MKIKANNIDYRLSEVEENNITLEEIDTIEWKYGSELAANFLSINFEDVSEMLYSLDDINEIDPTEETLENALILTNEYYSDKTVYFCLQQLIDEEIVVFEDVDSFLREGLRMLSNLDEEEKENIIDFLNVDKLLHSLENNGEIFISDNGKVFRLDF